MYVSYSLNRIVITIITINIQLLQYLIPPAASVMVIDMDMEVIVICVDQAA